MRIADHKAEATRDKRRPLGFVKYDMSRFGRNEIHERHSTFISVAGCFCIIRVGPKCHVLRCKFS